MRASIAALSLLLTVLLGASATAGAATWSAATLLPETAFSDFSTQDRSATVADPLGRIHVITGSQTGTFWRTVNTDGSLGPTQPFPTVPGQQNQPGRPWHVAFNADGSALVGWRLRDIGIGYFTWRSPTGTWGPTILTAPGPVSSVAIRPTEALLGNPSHSRVYSVSIGGDGTLAFGPIAHLEGQGAQNESSGTMVVALDPGGTAAAVYSRYPVVRKASRDANGAWTPEDVDTFTGAGSIGSVRGGSQGGRMVAAYYRRDGASESGTHVDRVKALYREPGGAIGAPVPIADQSTQTGSRLATVFGAAAGPDGTLGVFSGTYQCTGATPTRIGSGGVRVVPPGQPLTSAATEGVAAMTNAGDTYVRTGNGFSLVDYQRPAAGGGRMVFSLRRTTSAGINGPAAGRACGSAGTPTSPTTVESVAVATGPGGASTTVASSSSPTGGSQSGHISEWFGAAVEDEGNAAVVGAVNYDDPHRLYLFGTPRAGGAPPDDGGDGGDDGDDGGAPGAGGGGAAGTTPAATPPPPPGTGKPPVLVTAPRVLPSAPVRLTAARPTPTGLDVTLTLPTDSATRNTTIAMLVAFGALRPGGTARAAQARKPVTLAKARRVVRRSGRLVVRMRYTKAGRALIRKRRRVRATIRITTTIQGSAPTTRDQKVTLRARR